MSNYNQYFISLLLLIFTVQLGAQRSISGTVLDEETNEPLVGANILIEGTALGTATDFDGTFSLEVPEGEVTLIFTYTGYDALYFPITDQNVYEIRMQSGSFLDEIVVTGYGTVKREDATGSIQSVNAERFNQGSITGPQELLAGKIAGVAISTGGSPGEGSAIRIRGETSLSASNNPLIVIDGIPIDDGGISGSRNPLNIIHPNDIESFTVLKDASASAIYGNRASGGVILITTKKGYLGKKIRVGYNGNFSVGERSGEVDILTADEFRSLINQRFAEGHPARSILGTANTNWQDEIYQTAIGHDHNLAVTGSLGEFPYRVSLGYTNKEGILKTDLFERYTYGINVTPGLLNNTLQLTLGFKGMSINNDFANRGAIGSALSFDPTQPIRDPENAYGGYYAWTQNDGKPNTLAPANPIALLEQRDDQSHVTRYIAKFQADYRLPFLPAVRANLNLAFDRSDSEGSINVPENAAFAFFNGGEITNYTEEKENTLLELYLNYKNSFGKHELDAVGGYSWQRFFTDNFSESTNVAGTEVFFAPDFSPREYFLLSLFGRINYSFDDRLLATFTLRRDGTSRFSPDNRWGLFPSAALGWNIINSPESSGLSNLKLRVGWGVTGQEAIGDFYAYLPRYQASFENARYQFGNEFVTTLRPNGYDANIKWEETTTINLALDYGILNNRLNGSLEFYRRDADDLLNFIPVPAGTNLTNFITTNIGDMETRGVELSLNAEAIAKADLKLDVGFNIAYNENEITKLIAAEDPNYPGVLVGGIAGGVGSTIQVHSEGYPAYSFYVLEQVYDNNRVPIEGLYVDRNGDGIVNSEDRYRLEKPSPDVTLGLTSRFQYKDLDLSFAGRGYVGNYIYNNVWSDQAFYDRLFNSTLVLSNVNAVTTEIDFFTPEFLSDHFVREASFFRMDHITLGYNFADRLIGEHLRLSLTLQNAFVISDYDGLDPEIFSGIDNNIYPRPRTFVFGIGVDF